jgi:hypothetical protein
VIFDDIHWAERIFLDLVEHVVDTSDGVPLLIISPFVKPGTICHDLSSFDSLLAFVEHNWNLGSLTQRDANANDLFSCFNSTLAATKPATTAGPLMLGMVPEPKLTRAEQKAIDHEITRDRVNDPDD